MENNKNIKRNSPHNLTPAEKHLWYLHNCPDYKNNQINSKKQKKICECGAQVSSRNMATHKNTFKHDMALKNKNHNMDQQMNITIMI